MFSEVQRQIVEHPVEGKIFLEGAAGMGKTTVGVGRLNFLLASGVRADEIAVIVPQRTLGLPYDELLRDPSLPDGGEVKIATLGSLGREMVDLFWVIVAEEMGFQYLDKRPTFLSLETAQYYMARVAAPIISEKGYFETITIDRNRLYSQILDNLSKAAVVGFPITEIAERLKSAWIGEDSQQRVYDEVQDCAIRFRAYCQENSLIDFSLQTEIFRFLWELPQARNYLTRKYKHLIVDNLEEDSPLMHDVLRDWLSQCTSALLIYDQVAGYRRFLGADEQSGYALRDVCDEQVIFTDVFVASPEVQSLGAELALSFGKGEIATERFDPRKAFTYDNHRYHTQMLDWTAQEITALVANEGVSPDQIVVVAPYLSDALRFSLINRLNANGIAARSHRPSRSLREEVASQCLLTLAQIAHPEWNLRPTVFDLAYAFMTAIDGLDLVRAQLLAQIVYRQHEGEIAPFEVIRSEIRERITYIIGERYDRLRNWLQVYIDGEPQPLDHFWSRLFGEVLSQPGYGFHQKFEQAEIAANLIDSARKFRHTIAVLPPDKTLAQEFVQMVLGGIIADQYLSSWQLEDENAVFIAPAYTFLMRNTPVDYQFWLNIGGKGWAERLYQPLTHPYVLTRHWQMGRQWTDFDEVSASSDALYRLVVGLTHRCRKRIYLGYSELGEQGYEQQGGLLQAIQQMLRRWSNGTENFNVQTTA
jgi:hypothetical protein